MQRLAGGRGEIDVTNAAVNMDLHMKLSSQATTSLEDIAFLWKNRVKREPKLNAPLWMQIYLYGDLQRSVKLIQRAEGAKGTIFILTRHC